MNEVNPLRRLMENDKTLTSLWICPDDRVLPVHHKSHRAIFPRGKAGWKHAGEIVGNNTILHELCFRLRSGDENEDDTRKKMQLFFNGVKRNNSIQNLSFLGWDNASVTFPFIAPFIQNNCRLAQLSIRGCRIGSVGVGLLASALSNHHQLEFMRIHHCDLTMISYFAILLEH